MLMSSSEPPPPPSPPEPAPLLSPEHAARPSASTPAAAKPRTARMCFFADIVLLLERPGRRPAMDLMRSVRLDRRIHGVCPAVMLPGTNFGTQDVLTEQGTSVTQTLL